MLRSNSILHVSLALYIFLGAQDRSYAQDEFIPTKEYCVAGDFSDRCIAAGVPVDAPEQCNPIKDAMGQTCLKILQNDNNLTWYNSAFQSTSEFLSERIIEAILATLSAILAFASAYFRNGFIKLRRRLLDPFIKRAPRYETLGVNVLVLGKGGTGKTSIVRALSGSSDADPAIATAENNLYSLAHELNLKKEDTSLRRIVRFFISDHVGQDFASISKTAFYADSRLSSLPKCLIVVADIFAPDENYGEDNQFARWDSERIRKQIETFHDDQVRTITGDLKEGSRIVLFINKIDKLQTINANYIASIISEFNEMINVFRRIRGTKFYVVIGSANSGQGISGCKLVDNDYLSSNLYPILIDTAESVEI